MQVLFFLHITLGIVSLICCVLGVAKALFKTETNYIYWIKMVGLTSFLSVVSGIALYLTQAEQTSFARFCMKLGLYLIVIIGTEAVLYFRLREFRKTYLS